MSIDARIAAVTVIAPSHTCPGSTNEQAASADYWCVMATCGRKATQARVMTATVQPVCDSCAAWLQRGGSKVIPLAEALAGVRD